jgi:arylsulfatase A-like enzyme
MTMMDYFPTLAAAAGIEPGKHQPFDGRNLWPDVSAGRVVARDDIFFSVEGGGVQRYAVHHQEWKLVVDGEKKLLFRIGEDPNETTDLAAKEPKLVADLSARIDQWKQLHPKNGERSTDRPPAGFQSPPQWAEAAR